MQSIYNTSFKALSVHLFGLIILIFLIVFVKLDYFHIRNWDESLFAVNTYEMLHNGKYFSLYYDGHPDLLNTKPPMVIWFQLLFVKLIGYDEMAIRLPSAIAAALSILVVFLFIAERYGLTMAWLSALILLTSQGFITFHTARGGEADSLLTFFVLIANIYFLKYIYESNQRFILYFFLFITLAFCTKLYAALLFVPAYIAIALWHRKLKQFIFNRFFLIGTVFFLAASFTLLYLRELDTPGYFKEIFFKDAGRVFNVVESHKHPWNFYLDNFSSERFTFWFVPLIIGLLIILFKRDEKDSLMRNLALLSLSYLLIISLSVTKLHWYDMPLYPYLSILAAFGIFHVLKLLIDPILQKTNTALFLVILFLYPFWIMFRNTQANTLPNSHKIMELNERYLFVKSLYEKNIDGLKVYHSRWNGAMLFYKYKFADAGQRIELLTAPDFKSGDKVLLSDDSLYTIIKNKYPYEIVEEEEPMRVLLIK